MYLVAYTTVGNCVCIQFVSFGTIIRFLSLHSDNLHQYLFEVVGILLCSTILYTVKALATDSRILNIFISFIKTIGGCMPNIEQVPGLSAYQVSRLCCSIND